MRSPAWRLRGSGLGRAAEGRSPEPSEQALSPYNIDATVLSKLSVAEGLTALDKDVAAAPASATSWKQTAPTTWTFELRTATFQDDAADEPGVACLRDGEVGQERGTAGGSRPPGPARCA